MITIIDYGVGNLASIQNMLKKVGVASIISGKPDDVNRASKLILPGMGAFDNCMEKFQASGLREIIERSVFEEARPVLGICVGLQMYMESSEEGVLPGLGWIKGRTVRFDTAAMNEPHKVPNMGWLEIAGTRSSRLLQGLDDARFYFAHSYHVSVDNRSDVLIEASYGYKFTCAIERENIVGVQFHPEKSHRFGMTLLKNFAVNF